MDSKGLVSTADVAVVGVTTPWANTVPMMVFIRREVRRSYTVNTPNKRHQPMTLRRTHTTAVCVSAIICRGVRVAVGASAVVSFSEFSAAVPRAASSRAGERAFEFCFSTSVVAF